MELTFAQCGGKLEVREIELVKFDFEAKLPNTAELANKLIDQEEVGFRCRLPHGRRDQGPRRGGGGGGHPHDAKVVLNSYQFSASCQLKQGGF